MAKTNKNKIVIVDVKVLIEPMDVRYNESLLAINHDAGEFYGWPVSEKGLSVIEKKRFETLKKALK
jgi:hypothetical protein